MSLTRQRATPFTLGLLFALVSGAPVVADDTELFVFDNSALTVNPNILFILDTSGSMDTAVESQQSYDPAAVYDGSCRHDRLYWRTGTGDPPACDTDRWFDASALKCVAASDAFATSAGRLTDRFAQYDAGEAEWRKLSQNDKAGAVECDDDRGIHGDGANSGGVYAQSGDADNLWSGSAADEISWQLMDVNTVYTANYLNWHYGPTGPSTRMQVLKDVAAGLAGSINDVNIGLMQFNSHQGGRLVHAVQDVANSRSALIDSIDSLTASGFTPLSETMYEAALYFLGHAPHYGTDDVGVAGGAYQTPIGHGCQKSFIVYLTDGEPADDTDANDIVPTLPGFVDVVGPACDGSGDGACLDDLAAYLYGADLNAELPGKQNVATYTIGFTLDLPLLSSTAQRGGGRYYTADDTATLSQALTNIVTSILETQTTFTAPSVSVNSFNRARHANDLFVSVFQPSEREHWPGNLKKYRLRAADSTIVDANGAPAVDPDSGFFYDDAQSWWSDGPDGRRVPAGGAANRLPAPDARRVYTYLGGADLTAAANAVTRSNVAIDDALLEIGDPGDPSRDAVIDFMRGWDVADANQNSRTDEPRNQMGDPLHAQPISLIYGGTPANPDPDDALVFFATNDGYLHAIDPTTGVERWAFVAPEFLGDQVDLLVNPTSSAKRYGIDGSLRLQVQADGDGVLDASAGEKAYLYFGMRRGGPVYYALDVTYPDAPRVLWRRDRNDLPDLGQTWSNPVPTRVDVQGAAQNDGDLVVVLGGGYDTTQDNYDASTDNSGNALYIVDSVSGALLWHGAPSGGTKSFADMRYSMPADIRVIDLDGDGYADRMYAADMGGQVWRFDIDNGSYASSLVDGGVIARLGSAGLSSPTAADTRRFYYAPDVALVSGGEASFLHVGIGSGYRAHPNAMENQDRFFALRDYNTFNSLTQAAFDAMSSITEADLIDVTDDIDAVVPAGSAGWRLRLGPGEKVLSEASTFNNQVFFTTFAPGAAPDVNDCEPRLGTNRVYIVSLYNGAPVNNLDGSLDDETLTAADRSRQFSGSIASEVTFLFPSPDDPDNCVGDECSPRPVACVDLFCFPTDFGNTPIRTFWSQRAVDR
jgi:type IV pilus assembly protein PilY1